MSRGRKATLNTAFGFIEELVSLIAAFVMPRLILATFGSKYNGLATSISQFLACAVLLRAGIGGATRAALYKPLAEHDQARFNSIVRATDLFMKRIGLILLGAIILFSTLYPLLVRNEFGWLFTASLFLIIGLHTFAESFFGITYLIVLQADQRLWVVTAFRCVCILLRTGIGAALILSGFSLHVIKASTAVIYVLYPLLLGVYVRRRYKIDLSVKPDFSAIAQRWDAFWHQTSLFIMNNTDVVVLTVFTSMLEVSVYSVYTLVFHGIQKTVASFTNGLEGAFGNMLARKEYALFGKNFAIVENMLYGLATAICTACALIIFDFVRLYTRGITDVAYIRPDFAYVALASQFFNAVRIPYQMAVQAAGHYKQTKWGAIVEPIVNIVLSILFVIRFGLVGVAVGTLAATVFRTWQYSVYMGKHILPRNWMVVPFRLGVSAVEAAASIFLVRHLHLPVAETYAGWFLNSLVVGIVCLAVVCAGSLLAFRQESLGLVKKCRAVFSR